MVTEFLSIQPSSVKVQLKDATCPRSLFVCECIFLNARHQPLNVQTHHCKSSGLVFGLDFFFFF